MTTLREALEKQLQTFRSRQDAAKEARESLKDDRFNKSTIEHHHGREDAYRAAADDLLALLAAHPVEPTADLNEVRAAALEAFADQVGSWPDNASVPVGVVKALAVERAADLRVEAVQS